METEVNLGGKPLAFPTVESLQIAIDAYFDTCDKLSSANEGLRIKPYTMAGLANALGVDRQTVINYGKKDEYFGTVKRARAIVEQYAEERLFGNSVTGVIFNLKNNFGWKDGQDLNIGGQENGTPITHRIERVIVDNATNRNT